MLKSGAVNPEHVRGEMEKLNPSKATETSLDSTSRDDERLPQRRTGERTMAAKCIHRLHRCAQGIQEGSRGEPMTGNSRKCISKFAHPKVRQNARQLRVLGSFVATHGNVPRKIRAADQSKRD